MTVKGQYLGGIRTIDDVRLRCFVDADGCWHWRGATTDGTPIARIGGKCVTVRRWAAQQTRPLQSGFVFLVAKCGHTDCVSPRCAISKRGPDYMRWLNAQGAVNTASQKKRVADSVRARAITKLNPAKAIEVARRVRAGEDRGHVAAQLGITRGHASKVARGESWAEFVDPRQLASNA